VTAVGDGTAIRECDRGEEALRQTVEELRAELEGAGRLDALLPFCSACQLDIVIPGDAAAIRTVTDGVGQLLRGSPGLVGHEFDVELALQEALANAVRHGCRGDRTKSVECHITYEGTGELRIVVRDPGPGFDVSSVPSPLEDTNLLRANGRGLFLINQLMDEVRFADGGREIHMRKRHSPWSDKDGF
jgi:anti-sigma regulatory factor (Ser/Thr protein kinase)